MYTNEIAIIKADLGIEDLDIDWRWVNERWLRRTSKSITWGDYQHRQPRPRISIATERRYEDVIKCIAHELRHAWQRKNGVLLVEYIGGRSWKHTWHGTPFCTGRKVYRRKKYAERPHEIDALAYQEDAWVRLFKYKPDKRETPKTKVAGLFLGSMY